MKHLLSIWPFLLLVGLVYALVFPYTPAVATGLSIPAPHLQQQVLSSIVINEVDADQAGIDTAEFIELFDGGAGNTSLTGLVVVWYNGGDDKSYRAFDLDGYSTNANGYFVIGNSAVAGAVITFTNNILQNGPDAVALYSGNGADFPTNTALTTANLLDALVYDLNQPDDAGLLVLLNAGQPQVNETGAGDSTTASNQRCPNGGGGQRNTTTYVQAPPSPGVANPCNVATPTPTNTPVPTATPTPTSSVTPAAFLFINEVDVDQTGTDAAEFVELYDGGIGNTPLDGLALVFYNGTDDASYRAIDLDGHKTDANGYAVVGNAAVASAVITFADGSLQNGADAVALYIGNATHFPSRTPISTTNLLDALVYATGQEVDTGLLALLNPGQPQVNEAGAGDAARDSNQRCPNASGGQRTTATYLQSLPSPGGANNCAGITPTPTPTPTATATGSPPATPTPTATRTPNTTATPNITPVVGILINEVDVDQTGTDTAEFIELYDGGVGNTVLDGLVLVFVNGSDDASYRAIDLDGYKTNGNGYFVLGNEAVAGVGATFANGALQNGADAVALYVGNGNSFPSGTIVTTDNLLDALVYDTGQEADSGLLALLNPGQLQINEDGGGDAANHSNQRCPNGGGGQRNSAAYVQAAPSPGVANQCPNTPTPTATATATLAPGQTATAQPTPTATNLSQALDSDFDGITDETECAGAVTCADTDGDGIGNQRDIDSDNDGASDKVEAVVSTLTSAQENAGAVSLLAPIDTDGDGMPDYLDTDSDNDTIPDAVEAHDVDFDGHADVTPTGQDQDGDGLDNAYDTLTDALSPENAAGSNAALPSLNGVPNWRNPDDDGDGILTAIEVGSDRLQPVDADQNGVPDFLQSATARLLFLPLVSK